MQQDKSLNVREFLLLMKDCGVISESFTISDVMRIFLKANYQLEDDTEQIAGLDDDHPVDNLESEMIYAEFVEGIARVAHRQCVHSPPHHHRATRPRQRPRHLTHCVACTGAAVTT